MKACIIGGGTMGRGIAEVFYNAQWIVKIVEVHNLQSTQSYLQAKNLPIQVLDHLPMVLDVDFVVEAVFEDMTVKRKLFEELSTRILPITIVATNTSSLSINALAASLPYKDRFIGWHFFNPAPKMPLVEVIPSLHTSEEVIQKSLDLLEKVGKKPILAPDTPGFIVNRIARFYYLENLRLLEAGWVKADGTPLSVAEIDALWEATGFRMGPFRLMDLIGVDINHRVSEEIYRGFYGAARFRPSWLQAQKVHAGLWGKKCGKGFYTYT